MNGSHLATSHRQLFLMWIPRYSEAFKPALSHALAAYSSFAGSFFALLTVLTPITCTKGTQLVSRSFPSESEGLDDFLQAVQAEAEEDKCAVETAKAKGKAIIRLTAHLIPSLHPIKLTSPGMTQTAYDDMV